jgi:hypothetical protein
METHQCNYLLDEEVKHFIGRTNTVGEFMKQLSMQEASLPNPPIEPF